MEKYTSFADAVKANDMYAVKEMLDENPTLIHSVTAEGLSMVMLAAYNHHFKMMEILTMRKRHLDIFEAAAAGNSLEVDRILAKDKTQLVAVSPDGYSALAYACWFGRFEVARNLIAKMAQVNTPANNPSKVTPLHSAVAGKHVEIAELLLKHGADVNAKQQNDLTPLHSAAANGHAAMVKLLVDNKADIHAKSSDGKTPSDLAKEKGFQEVVTFLGFH
jgi:ankyrin repeat protein